MRFLIVPLMTENKNSIEFSYSYSFINCVNAIRNINLNPFDKIFFVINRDVDNKLNLHLKIMADISRIRANNIDIVSFPFSTESMAETVLKTVLYIQNKEGVGDFSFFVKDGDNSIKMDNVPNGNYITCMSLETLSLVEPSRKSYINTDEYNFITNIIEKRVVSDKFVAGGYSFEHSTDFIKAYNSIKKDNNEAFHISDIIYYMIMFMNVQFTPVNIELFKDFNII
ncbi:hypothetical protein [uncultured Methanobrevibacter sp.]|uniref:hypothetical protein n=1 Tax=uncultured Methanobrevibacter sp. TaxID=253161 RepID=UPI0025F95212|nr:hypothetical protein [uncultured Methanobrevibacter sp.]